MVGTATPQAKGLVDMPSQIVLACLAPAKCTKPKSAQMLAQGAQKLIQPDLVPFKRLLGSEVC